MAGWTLPGSRTQIGQDLLRFALLRQFDQLVHHGIQSLGIEHFFAVNLVDIGVLRGRKSKALSHKSSLSFSPGGCRRKRSQYPCRFQPGKADQVLGQIEDFNLFTHIEDIVFTALAHG